MSEPAQHDLGSKSLFDAAVERDEFTNACHAEDAFWARTDHSLAQADGGALIDAELVFARLHERYANWPRAAAE